MSVVREKEVMILAVISKKSAMILACVEIEIYERKKKMEGKIGSSMLQFRCLRYIKEKVLHKL